MRTYYKALPARTGYRAVVVASLRSGDHPWPWADAPDEAEAERRFKIAYPSLHAYMKKWESLGDPETSIWNALQ
jgi:hypothetical protein